MDKKVKALWIAALESGEYEQARGSLKKVNSKGEASFCCLGVLCEVAVSEGVEISTSFRQLLEDGSEGRGVYDNNMDWLPRSVVEWAGMDSRSGELKEIIEYGEEFDNGYGDMECSQAYTLVDLNDDAEYSFKDIAKVIDKQF